MRILVVEDEPQMNSLITSKLMKEHYSVDSCQDGQDALSYIQCADYDAILLDIMLPGIDGIQVLREIRNQRNHTPVLLLTARDSIEDRVKGLDVGADDYLVKPFAFDELLARVRVLIRRNSHGISNTIQIANLTVDCDARIAKRDEVPIVLSTKEFSVLEYLARNTGTVLSRDRISAHIWNYEYEGGSNVVDVYIRYLRKKLDDGFEPKLIHTIRGSGYVLREDWKK